MDYLRTAFEVAKKEKLNFDGIVENFGGRSDVEAATGVLIRLYFDYTRTLFLLDDKGNMPLFKDVEAQLYWLRCTIEAFQKMKEPNGKIKIEM